MAARVGTTKAGGMTAALRRTVAAANPQDVALTIANLDISSIGWNTLEQRFYELNAMLSAPTSGLNANQARQHQKQIVSVAIGKLLDMAQQECRRLLIDGNAKAAVEGGLKTLKLKEEYYGRESLQLVPAYFHLARTNQYMDKFKQAEEFLSLAQWTILRHPEADVSLKAELHQTFGLLYASDGKLDAALKQLTCATYYLSVLNGPEHILTSFGYFDLGNVFAAKGAMENAMSFYDKVKEIWYHHLTAALRLIAEQQQNPDEDLAPESRMQFALPLGFGEENLQDAVKMLRGIVGLQCERYGRVHPSSGRAEQVLGMFMLWNGDAAAALDSLLRALEVAKRVLGERHAGAGEIRSLLLQFGLEVPEDTSFVLADDAVGPTQPQPPQFVAAKQQQQHQQEEHQQPSEQPSEQASPQREDAPAVEDAAGGAAIENVAETSEAAAPQSEPAPEPEAAAPSDEAVAEAAPEEAPEAEGEGAEAPPSGDNADEAQTPTHDDADESPAPTHDNADESPAPMHDDAEPSPAAEDGEGGGERAPVEEQAPE